MMTGHLLELCVLSIDLFFFFLFLASRAKRIGEASVATRPFITTSLFQCINKFAPQRHDTALVAVAHAFSAQLTVLLVNEPVEDTALNRPSLC